jgi:G protein-coupled receptor Mth (Methuselah protein)
MFLSIPFLVATFLVYACIHELRKLHGKAVMCYIFALILVYFVLAINRLNSTNFFKVQWLCKTLGYVGYCSTLSCFFWLSVMSFDIWSTFRLKLFC